MAKCAASHQGAFILRLSFSDGGHPQGEGGASRNRHLDHKQEHLSHPQDHRPGEHGAARAVHPETHRLHAAGRRGTRRQSKRRH